MRKLIWTKIERMMRNIVKRKGTETGDRQGTFPFEFERISEEKPEDRWQRQIREEIDAREREGQDTQTLQFRKVNDMEYDLEVNELDYDMEVEYLDLDIEYIDIGQE